MNTYTVRLMQDEGVKGPTASFEAESLPLAAIQARAWALAQTGWPWDIITLTDEESNEGYELQLSDHGAGRKSIQVFDKDRLVADINV